MNEPTITTPTLAHDPLTIRRLHCLALALPEAIYNDAVVPTVAYIEQLRLAHESALRREAVLREALKTHGKHYVACKSQWPSSNGGHQTCDCGFAAALADSGSAK